MKKIVSVLLSIILFCVIATPGFAGNCQERIYGPPCGCSEDIIYGPGCDQ